MSRGTTPLTTTAGDDGIELLPPNDAAFGSGGELQLVADDAHESVFDDDEPRPAWPMVVAGLLVLALIAAGVVAAAPWQSDDVTAVTVPTTAAPAPTPAPGLGGDEPARVNGPTGWVTAPPSGWQQTAFVNEGFSGDAGEQLQVWSTPGADWGSGGWLAVHTVPYASPMLLLDATRFTVDDRTVVMATDSSGITTTQVSMPTLGLDPMSVTVTYDLRSRGLTLDQLIAFVADFHPPVDEQPIEVGDLAHGPLAGFTAIWSGPVVGGFARLTGSIETASITSADGGRTGVGIGTSDADPSIDALLPVLYEPVATVALAARRPASTTVTVWRDATLDDRLFATWIVGDERVTAFSYRVDEPTFLAAVASAAPATAEEWDTLLDRPIAGPPSDNDADVDGTMPDGTAWSAVVSIDQLGLSTAIDGWATGLDRLDATTVRHFVATDIDVVLATAVAGDPARTMVVTVVGREPVIVPLVEIGDTGARTGLYADRSVVDATVSVQLLDAEGNAVVSEQG